MAHTQHGNDDRKKRKKPPCPDILVSTGPWLRSQWHTAGGANIPCQLYPGNPPWSDPVTIPPITGPTESGKCFWVINSGTFPFVPSFQIVVAWGPDIEYDDAWHCLISYTSDGSIIPPGNYQTDFRGPTGDDPSGTYTQTAEAFPLCPTADPSTIAVTLLP